MDSKVTKFRVGWPRKFKVPCKYCGDITLASRDMSSKVCFDCHVKLKLESGARYRKLHPFKSKKKNHAFKNLVSA